MSALEDLNKPQFAPHSTLADFEVFIQQPENDDQIFELINGEIVPLLSNPYVSKLAFKLGFLIQLFLIQNSLDDHITGEAAGYIIQGNVYAPDVAYISHQRQPTLPRKGFNPGPPDLAVERARTTDLASQSRRLSGGQHHRLGGGCRSPND